MKARVVAVALVGLVSFSAWSQAEYDDVYFSKKDRQKAEAKLPKVLNKLDQDPVYASLPKSKINSANGYTGRTINPDYQGSWETGTDDSAYFIPDYQPANANNNLNQYPGMYSQGGFGSFGNRWGMRGLYSPFNSGFGYSPFGYSPFGYNSYGMYDPFMSGYNSWGYNNAWGYSPYSTWGNPYYGYGSGFGYGYGCNFGYGSGFFGNWFSGGYFGQPVYVVSNPDNNVNRSYGKRSSRNDGVVSTGSMSRGSQVVSSGENTTRGGRVATTNTGTSTTNRYYQRGWRQDPAINPSAGTSSGSRSTGWVGGTGTSSGRTSTSFWGNTNTGTTRSSWSNDSFGGGSRSSGTSFGTGGGGGRSIGGSSGGGGGTRSSGGGGRGRN